jgi:hypothetical protein
MVVSLLNPGLGNAASATFNLASSAPAGVATVTVSTSGGSATFAFTASPVTLTKEYIYVGGKLVATEMHREGLV